VLVIVSARVPLPVAVITASAAAAVASLIWMYATPFEKLVEEMVASDLA
jgi:hypothetical protein